MNTFMPLSAVTEVAGNVKTIEGYVVLNFEAASVSKFRANQNQAFV